MAQDLQGERVTGRGGVALGTIEDVMIDVRRGVVAYALVATPECDGQVFAVPWSALRLDARSNSFLLDADSLQEYAPA